MHTGYDKTSNGCCDEGECVYMANQPFDVCSVVMVREDPRMLVQQQQVPVLVSRQ